MLHLSIRTFFESVVCKRFWMLQGYTVAKACASPRTFDLVHQTVSPGDKTTKWPCRICLKWQGNFFLIKNLILMICSCLFGAIALLAKMKWCCFKHYTMLPLNTSTSRPWTMKTKLQCPALSTLQDKCVWLNFIHAYKKYRYLQLHAETGVLDACTQ